MTTITIINQAREGIKQSSKDLEISIGELTNRILKIFLTLLKSKEDLIRKINAGFTLHTFPEEKKVIKQIKPYVKRDSNLRLFSSNSEFFRFFDLMINLGFISIDLDYSYENKKIEIEKGPNSNEKEIEIKIEERENNQAEITEMEYLKSLVKESQEKWNNNSELNLKLNSLGHK